jgi:hypothetical protein
MKTFNASDLAHKRTEIFEAAKADGAILQRKNTNGEVLDEFIICSTKAVDEVFASSLSQRSIRPSLAPCFSDGRHEIE